MTKEVYRGGKNVFEDLGDSEPERTLVRAQLMGRITDIILQRGLTQVDAGRLLGLQQGRVSELMNGKLSKFSLEHLLRILNSLDKDVEIVVKPKRRQSNKPAVRVVISESSKRQN